MQKRGQYANIELWFLIAAFLLAAVAGVDLLKDAKQRLDGTLLERNYIARDLALALEAIYASPGDISYTYNLGDYMNRFLLSIQNGKVVIKGGEGEGDVSYRIIGSSNVALAYFVMSEVIDEAKPVKLVLSKKFRDDGTALITVTAENARWANG